MASNTCDFYVVEWGRHQHNILEKCKSDTVRLALKKRQIMNEELNRLKRFANQLRPEKKSSSNLDFENQPFITFYLKVYEELCGKCTIHDILGEATKRWHAMKRNSKKASYRMKRNFNNLMWKFMINSYLPMNPIDLERLQMAIIKQQIVQEERKKWFAFLSKIQKKKPDSKSFLKLYLQVYREMCGVLSCEEIKKEALRRWEKEMKGEKPGKPTGKRSERSMHFNASEGVTVTMSSPHHTRLMPSNLSDGRPINPVDVLPTDEKWRNRFSEPINEESSKWDDSCKKDRKNQVKITEKFQAPDISTKRQRYHPYGKRSDNHCRQQSCSSLTLPTASKQETQSPPVKIESKNWSPQCECSLSSQI